MPSGLTLKERAVDAFLRWTLWVTPSWWRYLFSPNPWGEGRWTTFWCRVRGHPNGWIYYNSGGLEPDDRCVDCGEHLC